MYIYLFTFFILFVSFLIEINTNNKRLKKWLFYIGAFLVTFILAFRGDNVGGDTIEYCYFFDGRGSFYGNVKYPVETIDLGFVWFCRFLRLFSDSHFLFIFSTSIITLLPFLYVVWKESTIKLLPLCLYMVSFHILTLSQTCIRQNLSISLLFCIYILYKKGNINFVFKCFITFLLVSAAILCHATTALTVLIGLAVFYIPINRKQAIILVLSSLFVAFLIPRITLDSFDVFYSLINSIDGGRFARAYGERVLDSTFHKILLVDALFAVGVLWISSKKQLDSGLDGFPLKCLAWGVAITFLGNGFDLVCRMVLFLTLMGITATPNLLFLKRNDLSKIAIILSLLLYETYQVWYLSTAKSAVTFDQLLPYNFIFE